MVASARAFFRGPVGALTGAVSFFLTVLSVEQFLTKSGNFWMWLAFAFAALFFLAFWRYHEDRQAPARIWAVKDLLGKSLTAGEKAVGDGHKRTVNSWRSHTRHLVAAALGEGEAARVFHSPPDARVDTLVGSRRLDAVQLGGIYVSNLRDLIARVGDPLMVRPDFSPKAWSPFDPTEFESDNARPRIKLDNLRTQCPWCKDEQASHYFQCQTCGAEYSGRMVFRPEAK